MISGKDVSAGPEQGQFAGILSEELGIAKRQALAAASLLAEGATVPFIARYRKERTGGLDEVQILAVRDGLARLEALEKRREAILKSLKEEGVLTEALEARVRGAETLAMLEDIYLPFRPKRRTRGSMARDKGLEPLAETLLRQEPGDPEASAARFIDASLGVADVEEALSGARDILAERFSEDAEARAGIRELFARHAAMRSEVVKGQEQAGAKYAEYFDRTEPLARAPSHRILAVLRGAEEGILRVRIRPDEEEAVRRLLHRFVRGSGGSSAQVALAVRDGYKRLLAPSLESETRAAAKDRADMEAIAVFSKNLRHLLLAPPLGGRRMLALDPGFRTGCKLVCLDAQGALLHHETIFPLPPQSRTSEAAGRLRELASKHGIEAVAVGNGTGGREAHRFCRDTFGASGPAVFLVNESGASVYSASEAGREEFPDQDVTVRGAVSIGRRLMDPLAELVKIDPKSIGVGQYQHDVSQTALEQALDDVVVSCVNSVGVEVNTASARLLRAVSGLTGKTARSIVAHRDGNGPFRSRSGFLEVPGLGPKTFEQCAGFLRIRGAENPLDETAIHPESYSVVEGMARSQGCSVADLVADPKRRAGIDPAGFVSEAAGLPTVLDILDALGKAGRDPRDGLESFAFPEEVKEITDLKPGMVLPGIVTNVTAFGAFVDVGVHHDGLVHVSQLADRYVADPGEVVHVTQRVRVTVLEVDLDRKRISLSMKKPAGGD